MSAMPICILVVILIAFTPVLAQDTLPTVRSGKVRPDGTVLCRNRAAVAFVTEQLLRGASLPDFNAMGCTLLLEGTLVSVEDGDRGFVTAETIFGKTVRGVADLATIELVQPAPDKRSLRAANRRPGENVR